VWFSERKISEHSKRKISVISISNPGPVFLQEILSIFLEPPVEIKGEIINIILDENNLHTLDHYLRPFLLSRGYIRYDSPYGGHNSHLGDSIYFKVSDRNLIKFQLFNESDYLLAYIDRLENRIERLEKSLNYNNLNLTGMNHNRSECYNLPA